MPEWILVVGSLPTGADPAGTTTITIRNQFYNPIPDMLVEISFENACDINLCTVAVPGQTANCDSSIVSGMTDTHGNFTFTVVGAAKDPGIENPVGPPGIVFPGGGRNDIIVRAGPLKTLIGRTTAACIDQDGASGRPGTNGPSDADLGVQRNTIWAYQLGGATPDLYRGRADADGNGTLNAADQGTLLYYIGREQLLGGAGCTAAYCKSVNCP